MARKDRPLIFTDDAWIMGHEPPLTPEIIRDKMVKTLAGTPASLWWSVGDHEVYHYETRVGEIMGEGYDLEELPDDLRKVVANTRHLMETCGGPLTVLVDLCREAGLEFFPRVSRQDLFNRAQGRISRAGGHAQHPVRPGLPASQAG